MKTYVYIYMCVCVCVCVRVYIFVIKSLMPGKISTKLGTRITYNPENNTVGDMTLLASIDAGIRRGESKNNRKGPILVSNPQFSWSLRES